MKKSLFSIVLATVVSSTLFAQIPNNGFENWTTVGSYSDPDNWGTMNSTTSAGSVYTATKGTPGNVGASYLKLTSKTVGPAVVNGIAVSGVLDPMTMQPVSGFPFTDEPESLTGKWQHMIFGSSQGSVSVTLTKWNSNTNMRETVATGSQTLSGMAMSWANFGINLNYVMSTAPDSCIIVLKASGSNPTANDYLWVDNLAFTGSVAGLKSQENLLQNLSVYPNPAKGNVNLSFNSMVSQEVTIELTNIEGKIVKSEELSLSKGKTDYSIDISNFSKGIYLVKIKGEKTSEIRQIIIE